MDNKELKDLINLMNDNDLLELEIVEEGKKIRLKKMYDGAPKIMPMPMAGAPAQMSMPASAAPVAAAPAANAVPAGHVIKSPMVGSFYRSANPESPAYVDVGDKVEEGTVVCILEAMKVFNEIRAECTGKVVKIMVENGEAVEYGQPLFVIDTSA